MDKREPTIAELCKPLSAKVMPRSAMLDTYGNERTEGSAADAAISNTKIHYKTLDGMHGTYTLGSPQAPMAVDVPTLPIPKGKKK